MDIVDQVRDSDEEEEASAKVYKDRSRKKKKKPPKQNALSKQKYFIPQEVLNSRETPQGQPLHKKYGFVRAEKMSCKYCDRPPFHGKIGLAVHMMDAHGIDSEGDSEEEENEEVMEVKRSSRDVPVHLDYREQETSEEELSEIEAVAEVSESDVEVIDGVVDSDVEEEGNGSPVQKRDAANAEMISSSVRKVQKTQKTIKLGKNSSGPMDPGASDPNNNPSSEFLEDVMNDFMQM